MRKKITKAKAFLLMCAVALLGGLASCYPGGPDDTQEMFSVVTYPLQGYNYKQNTTFYLSDSISVISNTTTSSILPGNEAQPIIADIIAQMLAYGYIQETASIEAADIILSITAFENTFTGIAFANWFNGFWGWGWDAPFGFPVNFSFNTGGVSIDMTTKPAGGGSNTAQSIWNAMIIGVYNNGAIIVPSDINFGINQAFSQSPYLKIN